jgi:hypothetical protein
MCRCATFLTISSDSRAYETPSGQGCNFLADLDGNVTRQSIPFYPGVVSTSQEPIFSSTGLARDTLHTLRLSSFLPEPYCSGFQFTGVNITTGDADPRSVERGSSSIKPGLFMSLI